MSAVRLDTVRPWSVKRPKGLASYKPRSASKSTVARIKDLYERMYVADALQLGPRTVGYRLKESYVGEYEKDEEIAKRRKRGEDVSAVTGFKAVEEIVKRLGQADEVPFDWIADAASITRSASGYHGLDEFFEELPDLYERDRRADQPVVVEVYTEAKETLGLIVRVARERGVTVYSASGSGGPNIAHQVARRALRRAVERSQSTLILGVCDFDPAGIRNILRPHIEHLSAFLYGTAGNDHVIAHDHLTIGATPATASFQHLALTPEMAMDMVDLPADRERIEDYIESGDDLWTRDLDLISDVQKIELEALDPPDLRQVVVDAIDKALDLDVLATLAEEERSDREYLAKLRGLGPEEAS